MRCSSSRGLCHDRIRGSLSFGRGSVRGCTGRRGSGAMPCRYPPGGLRPGFSRRPALAGGPVPGRARGAALRRFCRAVIGEGVEARYFRAYGISRCCCRRFVKVVPMTTSHAPVPGPGILDIAPYVGGESKAVGVERPIRLASNESALGPSPKAIEAYRALAGDIFRYPDGSAVELREALGRAHGLDPDRIVCGSGSDELIALLQRGYAGPGAEVLYSRHGFLMYPIGSLAVGATPVAVPERELTADVDAFLARVTDRTRLVFIANPNNPTGTYLSADELARLHAGLPKHVVLAIDAAYAEFVNRNDYEPGIGLVNPAQHVVMLRTFSKIYALAGLRLGWAYCPPAIADVLNRIRGPFNVSAPALAAGIAAVEDTESLRRAQAHNEHW